MKQQNVLRRTVNPPTYLMLFSAVLTLLLSSFFLRDGIALSPDGWAYWEGAVSLLKGHGYTYFGGEPLTDWGALFSLYLAGIQKLVGIHGQALRLSILCLAGLTSGAWVYLFTILSNSTTSWPVLMCYALYVATFISLYYQILLSETLFLLLLAGLFISLRVFCRHTLVGQVRILPLLSITLFVSLLLACRNSALAFLPGLTLVLGLSLRASTWRQRILLPLMVNLLAIGNWLGFRALFAQVGSHPLSLGGHYSPVQYVQQLLSGIASLSGPRQLGLGWVVFGVLSLALAQLTYGLLRQNKQPQTDEQIVLCYLLILLLSGTGGVYLLFNFTYISDPLNGRFIWHLLLGIVGFIAAGLTWVPQPDQRRRLLLALTLIVIVQLMRTGRMLVHQEQETGIPGYLVTPMMTITPNYIAGSPLSVGSYTLVAPPSYEWIDRHYQTHTGGQVK